MSDGQDWRSQSFRAKLVSQIDDAIRQAGSQMNKTSQEMETHVFNKAKFKEEYLALVARLILHLKENKDKQMRPQQMVLGQMNPQMHGRLMQDPIHALTNLTRPIQQNQPGMIPAHMQQHRPGMVSAPQIRFQQQKPPLQRQDAFIVTSPQNITPVQSQPLPASGANLPFQGQPQNMQRQMPNQQMTSQQMANQQMTNQQMTNQQMSNQQMQLQQITNQQIGQAPSPAQNVCSPAVLTAPSPSSMGITPSPANRGGAGVLSPGAALNTPGNPGSVGAVPSPSAQRISDEQMYMDKLQKLSKFVGPLRKMVDKLEKDESRKIDYEKMKNLLDILTDPTKRVPYATLERCEKVLENHNMSGKTPTPSQPVTTSSIFELLYESIAVNIKTTSINHSLQRTFGPAISAFFGPPIRVPYITSRKCRKLQTEKEGELSNVLQGEIARLDSRFKVSVDPLQHANNTSVHLICKLEDKHLPSVPPLIVKIPKSYPQYTPECDTESEGYDSTPFFQTIQQNLEQSLLLMSNHFSLSALLNSWEISVRRSCKT